MKYLKTSLLVLSLFWGTGSFAQFLIPEKPKKETSVYDYIGLLSENQEKNLEQKLIRYSDSTSTQIVVAIIGSTEGEEIKYLATQWGHSWGVGQKGKDNGIFILLAKNDRRITIQTGYGIEGSLTDAMSRRIIENHIIPHFKQDDYYGGLNSGIDTIFQVLNGEFKEGRPSGNTGFPLEAYIPIIIFIVMLIILSSSNRRNSGGKGGGRKSGLDLWDVIILSNMGRGGSSSGGFGSGGGFGGGGFSGGFGGGGFGGGGASGGW
ncbi:MAG: methanol dehydrogenase [Maribacter sp.]|nr:MAG: methanol dehydrogenase [Maribacter sp.]